MQRLSVRVRLLAAGSAIAILAVAASLVLGVPRSGAQSSGATVAVPKAPPVSVALVEEREISAYDEFSGRLEAVERVEVRSRVAGAVKSVHFREGALVKEGTSWREIRMRAMHATPVKLPPRPSSSRERSGSGAVRAEG